MSAPSASRWSAFSVRPPSASGARCRRPCRSGTRPRGRSRSAAGSVRDLVDRAGRAAPDGVGDLAGAVGRLAALGEPRGERVGGQPGQSRARRSGVTGRCYRRAVRRSAATSLPTIPGRPRRYASHGIRRPPAGWTSSRAAAVAVAGRQGRARRKRAGRHVARLAARTSTARRSSRPMRRLDERARPGLVGADLALELDGRPRRVEAPVLAAQRPGQRRAVRRLRLLGGARRASHGPSDVGQQVGAPSSPAAPRAPAPSRRRRAGVAACATIGPVSRPASIRISVTPVSRSPARIAAGIGVAPRWRGSSDGWRLSAPCAQVEQRRPGRSGRSRRGRGAPGSSARTCGDRRRRRAAALGSGRRRRRARRPPSAIGVAIRCCFRPAGRGGAVTTPTSSTSGWRVEAPQALGTPNAPLPRKTVRTRTPPSPGPVRSREGARRLADLGVVLVRRRRRGSARPSTRGSRCTACRRGGRARAGAPARAARSRRP